MKFILLAFIGFMGAQAHAQSTDILDCKVVGQMNFTRLRVFDSLALTGYSFELYTYGRFTHQPPGPSATGDVTRAGLTFHNETIRIVHLFGEYAYMDHENGIDLRFPDSACVTNP